MKAQRTIFILSIILTAILLISCSPKEDTPGRVEISGTNTEKSTFKSTGDEICTQDGKPIIREFSTTWCPHCKWIKDTYAKVVKEYEGQIIAYQWDIDKNDDALTEGLESYIPEEELEIFKKYNPKGSIPTFVFGCKYVRVGNGYESQGDLEAEEAEFRKIIEELIAQQNN